MRLRLLFAASVAALAMVPVASKAQDLLRPAIDPVAADNPNAPRGTLAPEDDDPYAALGIRGAGYILYPSVTTTIGTTSNAAGEAGGSASSYGTVSPELRIESDWSRHAANLTLRGDYQHYFDDTDPKPTAAIDGDVRLDISEGWQADFTAGYAYEQQSRTASDFPSPADAPPGVHDLHGSAAISGGAGRARFTAEGRVGRTTYEDATISGVPFDQGDRDNTVYAARLRAGFELTPTFTPFVEGEVSRRVFDQRIDNDAVERSSTGYALRAGVAFDRDPILMGDIAVGIAREDFDDPALSPLEALSVAGSLVWMPTELTTVSFDASTAFNPGTDPASAGSVEHDVTLDIAYAWRRNVTLGPRLGFTQERYDGGGTETTVSAGVGGTWKVNRTLHVTADYRHEWFTGTTPADDYQSDAVQVGIRVQR